jgi:hypothetical protein
MRCALTVSVSPGRVRNASRSEIGSLAVGLPNVNGEERAGCEGRRCGLCSAARHGLRLGEKGAQPGGVEFLKAALFLRIDCGGQRTGKGRCLDRLAAILRAKDGATQLTGQGWAETRDIGVIPGQCGQPFSRLNAFGGKELGLGALLPVVLQCYDQDRAQTQTADCGGKGNGPARQAHDTGRIGPEAKLLGDVFLGPCRLLHIRGLCHRSASGCGARGGL